MEDQAMDQGVRQQAGKVLRGVQIGLLNFILNGPLVFMPIVNASF